MTAGDWDVWGQITWDAGTTTTWTILEAAISQTSATLATAGAVIGTTYASQRQISAAATNGITSMQITPALIRVSATTNIFLVLRVHLVLVH